MPSSTFQESTKEQAMIIKPVTPADIDPITGRPANIVVNPLGRGVSLFDLFHLASTTLWVCYSVSLPDELRERIGRAGDAALHALKIYNEECQINPPGSGFADLPCDEYVAARDLIADLCRDISDPAEGSGWIAPWLADTLRGLVEEINDRLGVSRDERLPLPF